MTYRKGVDVVKTEEAPVFGISPRGVWLLRGRQPVYRRHDLDSGFAMEHENLTVDVKGKRRVANTTSANTDAIGRDGVTRSSDEAPVMGVERRSYSVLEMKSVNLRQEGRSR